MPGIVRRILGAKVSAADLERALAAIDELPPEDRTDIAARVVCLIEAFGAPGRHEVSARVAAIDWRLQALARSGQPAGVRKLADGGDRSGKIAAGCPAGGGNRALDRTRWRAGVRPRGVSWIACWP